MFIIMHAFKLWLQFLEKNRGISVRYFKHNTGLFDCQFRAGFFIRESQTLPFTSAVFFLFFLLCKSEKGFSANECQPDRPPDFRAC